MRWPSGLLTTRYVGADLIAFAARAIELDSRAVKASEALLTSSFAAADAHARLFRLTIDERLPTSPF